MFGEETSSFSNHLTWHRVLRAEISSWVGTQEREDVLANHREHLGRREALEAGLQARQSFSWNAGQWHTRTRLVDNCSSLS